MGERRSNLNSKCTFLQVQRIAIALRYSGSVCSVDCRVRNYAGCKNGEFTAEPSRKKAYDVNLRWRIVYQRIAKNLTFERIARNLNISTATAHHIYAYRRR